VCCGVKSAPGGVADGRDGIHEWKRAPVYIGKP
jgi:hypothetical protein